ncbi:MAG: hypothetical protein Q8877_02910 [Sweet potato little leaf phytoplasma]|nr:hypothetical protein [Sweet potato little leaf phytoplasma]
MNPIMDPSSVFYLHPNENPGANLVGAVLTGNNYHAWSRAMSMTLKSKNKLRFIDGSLPKPRITDEMFEAWDRCNTLVVSWLNNSLDPGIAQSNLWMESAVEIWQDLKERYYQGDMFRIYELQEELYMLKQGEYAHIAIGLVILLRLVIGNMVFLITGTEEDQYSTPNDESFEDNDDDDITLIAQSKQKDSSAISGMFFTPDQHKAILALLQQSSQSSSDHSANQLTTKPVTNLIGHSPSGIICMTFIETNQLPWILDTRATDQATTKTQISVI